MAGNKIYCLMVSGLHLTDLMRTILYEQAWTMVQEQKNRRRIWGAGFEGQISTSFEMETMGSISGLKFLAEIDLHRRSGKVGFLIHPSDLPSADAAWEEWDPVGQIGASTN